MSMVIEISDPLASLLKTAADSRQIPASHLINQLLGECLEDSASDSQHQRRIELIKKSHRGNLDETETAELRRLQEEVDRSLERSDNQLLEYLECLKEEAGAL